MGPAESDPQGQSEMTAFRQGLQMLGWTGRNVRVAYRWADGDVNRMRTFAKELIALQPDDGRDEKGPGRRPLAVAGAVLSAVASTPLRRCSITTPMPRSGAQSVPKMRWSFEPKRHLPYFDC